MRDKRKARGKRDGLATVLTMRGLAKLGGEDERAGMAEWVKWRDLPGMRRPTLAHAVTYRRGLGQAIDIQEVAQVLGEFLGRCQAKGQQWAKEGQTLRGTLEPGQTRGVH